MNITKEYIVEEYVNKKRSFADIAKEQESYANAIRRAAIKFGIQPRDKSEAQSIALKEGRHSHPTKGKKRSEEVKIAISEARAKSWQNMSDEAYEARVQKGKDQWENMSDAQKKNLKSLAVEALQKTAKEGSKLEKFVVDHLKNSGFLIEFHKDNILQNHRLEIDIFLPEKNIAVEIDGPSHFLPIWGEEALNKTIKADNDKNGLLLSFNIHIIRVKCLRRDLSKKNMRDIAASINIAINNIAKLQKADIHEIEVN